MAGTSGHARSPPTPTPIHELQAHNVHCAGGEREDIAIAAAAAAAGEDGEGAGAGAGAHRPRVNRAAIREEVSGILAEQAETELGDAIRDAIDAIELGTYTEQEQGGGAAARRGSAGTHSGDDADARHGDDEDDDNDNDSEEEHWDNLFKL